MKRKYSGHICGIGKYPSLTLTDKAFGQQNEVTIHSVNFCEHNTNLIGGSKSFIGTNTNPTRQENSQL